MKLRIVSLAIAIAGALLLGVAAPVVNLMYVAVGYKTVRYSYDGATWIDLGTTAFDDTGVDVAFNGSRWVAIGTNSGYQSSISYSDDGIKWVKVLSPMFVYGHSILWNGKIWIAAGQPPPGVGPTIYTSLDGIKWTPSPSSVSALPCSASKVAWNGRRFVGISTGCANAYNTRLPAPSVAYSDDGVTWTRSDSGNQQMMFPTSVTSFGRRFVVVGGNPVRTYDSKGIPYTNNRLIYSDDDGVTWKPSPSANSIFSYCTFGNGGDPNVVPVFTKCADLPPSKPLDFVGETSISTIGGNGKMLIATVAQPQVPPPVQYPIDPAMAYSYNGADWFPIPNTNNVFRGGGAQNIVWTGGMWMGVGYSTPLAWSVDGQVWDRFPKNNAVYGIAVGTRKTTVQ